MDLSAVAHVIHFDRLIVPVQVVRSIPSDQYGRATGAVAAERKDCSHEDATFVQGESAEESRKRRSDVSNRGACF